MHLPTAADAAAMQHTSSSTRSATPEARTSPFHLVWGRALGRSLGDSAGEDGSVGFESLAGRDQAGLIEPQNLVRSGQAKVASRNVEVLYAAEALIARGVPDPTAHLAAELGLLALKSGYAQ